MKLRLPHQFQAALMAAIASVSLTTLSTGTAYATTLEDAALGLDDFTQASVDAAKADGWSFSDTGIATESGVYTTTAASSTITSSSPWTTSLGNPKRAVYAAVMTIEVSSLSTSGGVLLTSTNNSGAVREGIGYDYGSGAYKVESAWSGSKRSQGLINQNLANYADANGLVTVAIIYKGDQGNGNKGGASIFVADQQTNDTGLKGDDNTEGNPTMLLANTTGVKYTNLYMFGMTDGNAISDATMQGMMKEAGAYYWKGSIDGSWDGTTKNWTHYGSDLAVSIGRGRVNDIDVVGNTNTNVVFGADAATKSVTVDDFTYTGTMTVNDNYTFNMVGGANLTVAGNLTGTGDITLSGAGTLTVAGGASGDYVDVIVNEGASVNLQGKTGTDYKLRYTLAGGTLTNMGGGATGSDRIQNDQITLTKDSRVRGFANFYMLAGNYGVSYLNLNGNTLQKSGSNTFILYNTHVSVGTLDIEGGMIDFSTDKATPEVAANITLNGGNITGGIKYTADATLKALQTVSSDVQLELNGHKLTTEVAGEQTLTLSGNISGNGSLVKTGAGTLSLSGNNTITQTIELQQGNLYFNNGSVTVNANDIANFQAVEGSASEYSQGENGYLTSSAKYYLVKGAEGTTASAGLQDFYGGQLDFPQPSSKDVVFTFNVPTDKVYYVNTQVTYGDADAVAATSFVISKGATLTAADSSAYATPKVLHGEGTYALANGASALNTGLSLGTDWTGTVRVSGATNVANLGTTIQNLTQGASWVELRGVQGYLGTNSTYTGNIVLKNNGDTAALAITSSISNQTTVLAGDIKGDGDIERKIGNGNSLTFAGDISGWTGTYYNGSRDGSSNTGWNALSFTKGGEINANFINTAYTNNCYLTLNFQGDGTIVNGILQSSPASGKTAQELNVNVNADTTFNGTVKASTLTVAQGKTATFSTATTAPTISTLTGSGTVVLDATKSTSIAATRSGWTGTVTLTGNANGARTFSDFTNGANSTLELKGFGGWSNTWNGTYSQNIKLTDDEELGYAWYNRANTTTSDTAYATFTGKISGNGTLVVQPDKLNYKFTGDVSGWTGAFKYTDDSYTSTLVFSGSANEINARIWDAGTGSSQLKLQVDTAASFSRDVTVDELTVNTGQSATLKGGGTLGSLSGAGAFVAQGGTVTVNGTGSYTGAATVNSGTLAFTNAAHATSVSVAAGAGLTLGNGLTTTGNMTVGNGATLDFNASAPLTIGGSLTLGDNVTYNIGGVQHAGAYTVASAEGSLTLGTPGAVNLGSSVYSGTLSQQGNNLVLNVTQTGKVLHLLLLTGQSNSLGAVKGEPASAAMLNEYAPHTVQMWDGNMSGSVSDPSADTKNKAWQDDGKQWFTVQQQSTPTGKDAHGPAGSPYEDLKGGANLVSAWGGSYVMGPEYGFSYMMEKQGWNINDLNTTSIIKVSRDGGDSGYWNPADSKSICPQIKDTIIKAILAADAEHYDAISLDGLMFLQGESSSAQQGRDVKGVVNSMITWLQDGLAAEMQEGGRLAGVSGKLTVTIGDTIILGEPADFSRAGSKPSAETYKQWALDAPGQAGFVYAHDLGVLSAEAFHYDGNSQITIGARYAYTMAQVQGLDTTQDGTVRVRSQNYGDTDLGETSVSLNDDAAWWKSSGDKTAYSAESLASTVAVWDVSSAHMANGERITGGLALGGIRIEDPYSDGQNPGDHQATITINSDSSDHVLSIGEHGIALQQGDLSIGANVNATANQTWNTVYSPAGGTARTNHLAVTGTVTIGEGVLLTFGEGSHIQFNFIEGTGSLSIGNGVTLAMSQADLDIKGSEYSEDENGYRISDTVLIELTGDSSAITATLDQLHFEDALAGQTIKLSNDRKSMLLDTTTSKTFHVRDSVVVYGEGHQEILEAKSIGIHDMGSTGATLRLEKNLPGGDEPVTIVASGNGGTVNIASGVSLNASAVDAASSALAIAGSGEYVGRTIGAVGSFSAADVLGQGVALAQDWAGSVVVSGGNPSCSSSPYTSLDSLASLVVARTEGGATAYSSLVLNGVSGYFTKDMAVNGDIEFRGTGEGGAGTALTFTAGNSKTLTLNGNLSGSGDFLYNKNGGSAETVVMNGDIAAWTGNLRLGTQHTGGLNLTLGSGVTEAHFNITQESGNNKRPLTLTVNGSQVVDFMGSIGAAGAITKNGTGTLTLKAANTFSGGITVSAGTLVADNAGALGSGAVTIAQGGNLVINAAMSNHTANSFNNNGGVLTMQDGSSLTMQVTGGTKTFNLGNVVVNGSAGIAANTSTACYNALFNMTSLSSGSNGAEIVLATGAQYSKATVFDLDTNQTAAFNGTITVKQNNTSTDAGRPVALNLTIGEDAKAAEILKGSVIKLDTAGNTNALVGLGLNSDVTVKGIDSGTATAKQHAIFAGKATTDTSAFASSGDARTLTIDTAGTDHSTRADVLDKINLVKKGAGTQVFSGDMSNFNGSVEVDGGVLNIMNAASVNVTDVTIGANGTLGVYNGNNATPGTANEGTLTIEDTKTLKATGAGATLNANVELATGSTLDVAATGGTGLHLGSSLTINPGMMLSDADMRNVWDLEIGQTYNLMYGESFNELIIKDASGSVTATYNPGDLTAENKLDAHTFYNDLQENHYYVVFTNNGDNVGTYAIYCNVPEPATSTLSLLALCALAARRRRKG